MAEKSAVAHLVAHPGSHLALTVELSAVKIQWGRGAQHSTWALAERGGFFTMDSPTCSFASAMSEVDSPPPRSQSTMITAVDGLGHEELKRARTPVVRRSTGHHLCSALQCGPQRLRSPCSLHSHHWLTLQSELTPLAEDTAASRKNRCAFLLLFQSAPLRSPPLRNIQTTHTHTHMLATLSPLCSPPPHPG